MSELNELETLTSVIFEALADRARFRDPEKHVYFSYKDRDYRINELMLEVDKETEVGRAYERAVVLNGINTLLEKR